MLKINIHKKIFTDINTGDKKVILRNFYLEIKEAETVAVLGKSGCGKSSLLKIISGMDTDFEGEIFYENNLKGKLKLGVMYQDIRLLPWLNVTENILFAIEKENKNKNLQSQNLTIKLNKLLQDYELFEYKNLYPHQLSGGTQQRVALVRAIINSPNLLLLDEPLSAVNPEMREDLQKLLKQMLYTEKITTILVTHNKEEAEFLADRIVKIG